jgi:hypothetical protein
MEADSFEQQSGTQKAATSKWAAANAKMMEIMAWIRNRSSKVNAKCTEKQSVTLDSEKKDQGLCVQKGKEASHVCHCSSE